MIDDTENVIEVNGVRYREIPNINNGGLSIIVSKDNGKMHLSISHGSRYPRWSEIIEAREKYLPNVKYAAMILPPKYEYVNLHEYCFHVWEIRDDY